MQKKVLLKYSAIGPDNKQISNKALGEVKVFKEILNNKNSLRVYAYLNFPEELAGKRNVRITALKKVSKPKK
ncbi:MAG: hypothetical protein HYU69_13115 [Bacteroidetes bacterium]|nr:hypothetical protein [Bacteroidota bacterium]